MVSATKQVECESIQGVGVGLRSPHFQHVETCKPDIPWFEVLIDNYMGEGGSPLHHLERIREDYPITFHGVGMSLGSTDPLNMDYLKRLKQLIDVFQPVYISDHLCWTSVKGNYTHELLPLPYTEQAIKQVITNIQQIQDYLGCRILIENVSSYLTFKDSAMEEWNFLSVIAEEADCDILLDINNIYVSACNFKQDAMRYLENISPARVREMHLAGYEMLEDLYFDTHGREIQPPVWQLYEQALQRFGPVPTLIEWDNNIPAFSILENEAIKAKEYMAGAQSRGK